MTKRKPRVLRNPRPAYVSNKRSQANHKSAHWYENEKSIDVCIWIETRLGNVCATARIRRSHLVEYVNRTKPRKAGREMHGLSESDELAYWRERAQAAEKQLAELCKSLRDKTWLTQSDARFVLQLLDRLTQHDLANTPSQEVYDAVATALANAQAREAALMPVVEAAQRLRDNYNDTSGSIVCIDAIEDGVREVSAAIDALNKAGKP